MRKCPFCQEEMEFGYKVDAYYCHNCEICLTGVEFRSREWPENLSKLDVETQARLKKQYEQIMKLFE